MSSEQPGIGARLWIAFIFPWKILFDGAFAAYVQRAGEPALPAPDLAPEPPPEPVAPAVPKGPDQPKVPDQPQGPDHTSALQLLAILQREGRLIDFLQEEVSGFSDADVGGAARVVHEGCRRALKEYVIVEPVRPESEGDPVVLEPGFDPERARVTGNVVGEPPFRGRLAHHGWHVTEIRLPTLASERDARVVAPAEVEL